MSINSGFIQAQIKNPTRSLVMLDKKVNTVTAMHDVLAADVTSGLVAPATNTTVRSEIQGVSNQDISAADALTQVPAIEIFENDTWIADTTNNSDAAMNYQRMILSDAQTVDNTGTDDVNGVVVQVEPYGLPADKKAIFKFV